MAPRTRPNRALCILLLSLLSAANLVAGGTSRPGAPGTSQRPGVSTSGTTQRPGAPSGFTVPGRTRVDRGKQRPPRGGPSRPLLIHHTSLSGDQLQQVLSEGATRPVEIRPYRTRVDGQLRDLIRIEGGNSIAFLCVRLWTADPSAQVGLLDRQVFQRPAPGGAEAKAWEDFLVKLGRYAMVRGLNLFGGGGGIGPGAPGNEGPNYPGNDDGGRWVYDCPDCPEAPEWGKDCRDEDLDKQEAYDDLLAVEVRIQALQAALQQVKDIGLGVGIAKAVLGIASTAVSLATAGTGTALAVAASQVIVEMAANQVLEGLLGDLLSPEVVAAGLTEKAINDAMDRLADERRDAQADFDAAKAAWQECMAQDGPHMTTQQIIDATRAQEAHDNCVYQQEFHGIGCKWVYVTP